VTVFKYHPGLRAQNLSRPSLPAAGGRAPLCRPPVAGSGAAPLCAPLAADLTAGGSLTAFAAPPSLWARSPRAAPLPASHPGFGRPALRQAAHIFSLLSTTALLAAAQMGAAAAQYADSRTQQNVAEGICRDTAEIKCKNQTRGQARDNSAAGNTILRQNGGRGKNTEKAPAGYQPASPFSISIDGENLPKGDPQGIADYKSGRLGVDPKAAPADRQRQADLDLQAADIQVKYDGGDVDSILNVSTAPIRRSYQPGERIEFLTSSNYPDFIRRAEIRIYRRGKQDTDAPLAIVPVAINGKAGWVMPAFGALPGDRDPLTRNPDDFLYVLRVYDAKNRYDETAPRSLARVSAAKPPAKEDGPEIAPGVGDDNTGIRNIPLQGGAVTVFGRNVPPGYTAQAFGAEVPVDAKRQFIIQRILPPGDHVVNVALNGGPGGGASGLEVARPVNIPANDWFYVGLADITIGKKMGDANIEEVRPGEYERVYHNGRLAFYLKGKVKGKYLLTASADTTEDDLKNIFKNIDKKDARQLLRRLDPNDYYPIYGDDSSFTEDAPTKGRFYVRLERGDSHVLWGTSTTRITGTELLRNEREIYGANALYRSQKTTSFGERKTEATAYGTQPDALSERQEFLATGGSAYFMKRQDIVRGSETVSVETRDETTGRVIERRTLNYGEDYSFDYMQGVLLLQHPLNSTTGASGAVRDGALGGQKIYVLANYDYVPTARDVHGYSYGGRVQQWLNDKVRVGVTGMSETTGPADQKAYGADIQLRHSERTNLEAELAHSKGPGFSVLHSTDGGLSSWSSTDEDKKRDYKGALSWRVRGRLGLADVLGEKAGDSSLGGYYEKKKAGYSSLTEEITRDQTIWGADSALTLNKNIGLKLNYDDFSTADGRRKRDGAGTITTRFNDFWSADFGLRYSKVHDSLAAESGYNGDRADAGARLTYKASEDAKIYVFGQGSIYHKGDIDRNDRGGAGAELRLTDTIGLTGEASYGTRGIGALASLDYNPNADDHYYAGYRLDPDRAFNLDRNYELHGSDMGAIVAGMKRRLSDVASTYAENTYDLFGRRRSVTQTYGVNYTPNNLWSFDGGLEMGRVKGAALSEKNLSGNGSSQEDFDRYAPRLGFNYKNEEKGITANGRGEIRLERSKDHTRNQISYLFTGGFGIKTSKDWRMIANIDAAIADSRAKENTLFTDTDYVEASVGAAYRPLENDRLNGLFKYTWLYDMPGTHQRVGGDNLIDQKYGGYYAPAQSSHIISADITYDLYSWLSVGGKYGLRLGRVKYRQNDNKDTDFNRHWQNSTAHLGILRADLHWIKNWDMLLEGRIMYMPDSARTTDYGALTAIYRHLGDNFKLGLGYNFGRFSDDLRDQTYDDRGFFVNFIGKF